MAHYIMAVYDTLYFRSLWHIILWQFMAHIIVVYGTTFNVPCESTSISCYMLFSLCIIKCNITIN